MDDRPGEDRSGGLGFQIALDYLIQKTIEAGAELDDLADWLQEARDGVVIARCNKLFPKGKRKKDESDG